MNKITKLKTPIWSCKLLDDGTNWPKVFCCRCGREVDQSQMYTCEDVSEYITDDMKASTLTSKIFCSVKCVKLKNMTKTKIIQQDSPQCLEEEINKFLSREENNTEKKLIDIKYQIIQASRINMYGDNDRLYSALIIYEEDYKYNPSNDNILKYGESEEIEKD